MTAVVPPDSQPATSTTVITSKSARDIATLNATRAAELRDQSAAGIVATRAPVTGERGAPPTTGDPSYTTFAMLA